jgi:hypothetical protein
MKTLWCKSQENPSDRISHTWAPLKGEISGLEIFSRLAVSRVAHQEKICILMIWRNHGLINYKDTKTNCRHLKKLTC